MLANKTNIATLHLTSNYQTFYRNQMYYKYKLDENVLKTLI